ncbi:MAG: hypothetical protein OXB97_14275 [Rhodospirillales bacterium]|nr:hypothetical protein [Rhodospirillales bacterium]
MPDTVMPPHPIDPLPKPHPMDPRRGESLSPMFAAFLCWLTGAEPMTDPAITDISVSGSSVLAATSDNPFFDLHLGSVEDFERNLRGWGDVCGAGSDTVDGLVDTMRRAGR